MAGILQIVPCIFEAEPMEGCGVQDLSPKTAKAIRHACICLQQEYRAGSEYPYTSTSLRAIRQMFELCPGVAHLRLVITCPSPSPSSRRVWTQADLSYFESDIRRKVDAIARHASQSLQISFVARPDSFHVRQRRGLGTENLLASVIRRLAADHNIRQIDLKGFAFASSDELSRILGKASPQEWIVHQSYIPHSLASHLRADQITRLSLSVALENSRYVRRTRGPSPSGWAAQLLERVSASVQVLTIRCPPHSAATLFGTLCDAKFPYLKTATFNGDVLLALQRVQAPMLTHLDLEPANDLLGETGLDRELHTWDEEEEEEEDAIYHTITAKLLDRHAFPRLAHVTLPLWYPGSDGVADDMFMNVMSAFKLAGLKVLCGLAFTLSSKKWPKARAYLERLAEHVYHLHLRIDGADPEELAAINLPELRYLKVSNGIGEELQDLDQDGGRQGIVDFLRGLKAQFLRKIAFDGPEVAGVQIETLLSHLLEAVHFPHLERVRGELKTDLEVEETHSLTTKFYEMSAERDIWIDLEVSSQYVVEAPALRQYAHLRPSPQHRRLAGYRGRFQLRR